MTLPGGWTRLFPFIWKRTRKGQERNIALHPDFAFWGYQFISGRSFIISRVCRSIEFNAPLVPDVSLPPVFAPLIWCTS